MNIPPPSASIDPSLAALSVAQAEEDASSELDCEMVNQQDFRQNAVRQDVARRFAEGRQVAQRTLAQMAAQNGAMMRSLSASQQAQAPAKPAIPMQARSADRKPAVKEGSNHAARTGQAHAAALPSTMDIDQIGAWLVGKRDTLARELAERGARQDDIDRILHGRDKEIEGSLALATTLLDGSQPDAELGNFIHSCCDSMKTDPASPVKLAQFIYAQGGGKDFDKNLQMMRLAVSDMQSLGSAKSPWFSYSIANAYILYKSVRDIAKKRRGKLATGMISLLADEEETCFALLQPQNATVDSLTTAFKPADLGGRKTAFFYDEMENAVSDLPHSLWEQDSDRRQALLSEIRERLWAVHASKSNESGEADELKQRLMKQIRHAQRQG